MTAFRAPWVPVSRTTLFFIVVVLFGAPWASAQGGIGGTPPELEFSSYSVIVGEASASVEIGVSLSWTWQAPVSVDYATADGTAEHGQDYTGTGGVQTLTIPARQLSGTISIPLLLDDVYEGEVNETFLVSLSNPVNAKLSSTTPATVEIVDDDPRPTVFFSPVSYSGDEGPGVVVTVGVELSGPTSLVATVDYATVNGSATGGEDFVIAAETLQFEPLELSKSFTVQLIDDEIYEGDETFELEISNPNAAVDLGSPASAEVTIVEDEELPTVSLSASAYQVGEAGGHVELEVTLSGLSDDDVSVGFATQAVSATPGEDYTETTGTFFIPAGQLSATGQVAISNDPVYEGDEVFDVNLTEPVTGAAFGEPQTAAVTIVDNETPPTIAFTTTSLNPPETAEEITLTITLSGPSSLDVRVDYATEAVTAEPGGDYVEESGLLQLLAEEITATVTIELFDDDFFEGEEHELFSVTLSNPVGAELGSDVLVNVAIDDDEERPTVAFEQATPQVVEGDTVVAVTVNLSGKSAFPSSVDYATLDGVGTATAGSDYDSTTGELSFAPMATTGTFDVVIHDDDLQEDWETVHLALANPDEVVLGSPSEAVLRINDDEVLNPPQAVITVPVHEAKFHPGEILALDGTNSTLSVSYQVWFAALTDGDPMEVAHLSPTTSGSFTSLSEDWYKLRLVIATEDAMPEDALLRGADLPCEDLLECDSAEVLVTREVGEGLDFNPVVQALSPSLVKFSWTDPEPGSGCQISRKTEPDGAWEQILFQLDDCQDLHFDETIPQSDKTYTYKVMSRGTWTESSEVSVFVPTDLDSTLSLLPSFETVWPEGFVSHLDSLAQVHILLQPEDPTADTTGWTVELWVDESTWEEGRAPDPSTDLEKGVGRDAPVCGTPAGSPDQTFTVTDPFAPIEFVVTDLVSGEHSFRFRVSDQEGNSRDRAVLRQVLKRDDHPGLVNLFGSIPNVGSGPNTSTLQPRFFGFGPASRYSADCQDDDGGYYVELVWYEEDAIWERKKRVYTDEDGRWEWTPETPMPTTILDSGLEGIEVILYAGRGVANTVETGRALELADPVYWGSDFWDLHKTSQGFDQGAYPYQTVELTYNDGAPDQAPYLPPSGELGAWPETVVERSIQPGITDIEIRFRVFDDYQNINEDSITVTNNSLGGVSVDARMSGDQRENGAQGQYDLIGGWWEALVPLGEDENELLVEGCDRAPTPNCMSTAVYTTRTVPVVVASIAAPEAGDAFRTFSHVTFDGSASEGPPDPVDPDQLDVEAKWVFLTGWPDDKFPLFSFEQDGLVVSGPMPAVRVFARLVVATPGNMPEGADLYTPELPCSIYDGGSTECDSTEIFLFNPCCPLRFAPCFGETGYQMTLQINSPAHNDAFPPDQPINLIASTEYEVDDVYRWWIYPEGAPSDAVLITPNIDDGFDEEYAEYTLDPVAMGLGEGSYVLKVEAALADGPCVGEVHATSIVIHLEEPQFKHDIAAIAPGQAFAGDMIRVYSPTVVAGDTAWVLIDDDLNDGVGAIPISGVATAALYLDVALPPDTLSGLYYVSVADDADGLNGSDWVQALEVAELNAPVTNEEDESCGGAGTECSHAIVSGQTLTGNWFEAGDVDHFYFAAAENTRFDVLLERDDTTLSPYHPDSVDPELMIADPDGLIDAANAYNNDRSGDDTDAEIKGFVARKTGVYLILCRTSRGDGDYRVTLVRTGTAGAADFEVVPYGPRAVNVLQPWSDEAPSARLEAVLVDSRGLPAGGAFLDWTVEEGAIESGEAEISGPSGVASGFFKLEDAVSAEEPGSATFSADYSWAPMKNLPPPAKAAIDMPVAGPVGGVVRHVGSGGVRVQSLAGPGELRKLREASRILSSLQGTQRPAAEKTTGGCSELDPELWEVKRVDIEPPTDAVSVAVTLAVQDSQQGDIPGPLEGTTVAQPVSLSLSLTGDWLDAEGTSLGSIAFPPSGPDIFLEVADVDPAFSRGIDTGGGTCPEAIIQATGDSTPFSLVVGERAVFDHLDELDEPKYAAVEVLGARTRFMVGDDSSGWELAQADTSLEIAPKPDEPASIDWIHNPTLVIPRGTLQVEELDADNHVLIQHGPSFFLLDEYGNLVVLWGKDDSDWHQNGATDEVFVPDWGTEGSPPWAGIRYSREDWWRKTPGSYTAVQFASDIYTPPFDPQTVVYGQSSWDVCARSTKHGQFCSSWGIDNDTSLAWIYTLWPFCGNEIGSPLGDYVHPDDWWNADSYTTGPGQPLTFALSGKPWVVRVDPMMSNDIPQPHSGPAFTDVPVKIWVNGPNDSPGEIRWTRSGPQEEWEPARVDDVEITTGQLMNAGECDLDWVPETAYSGEAELLAYRDDFINYLYCPLPGGPFGAAFSITKAPSEPGWYTIVVDTNYAPGDINEFPEYSQHDKNWSQIEYTSVHSFRVLGGRYLDENMQPFSDRILVGSSRQIYVMLEHDGDQDPLEAEVSFVVDGVPQSTAQVSLSRIGVASSGGSVYFGPVQLQALGAGGSKVFEDGPIVEDVGVLDTSIGQDLKVSDVASEVWVEIEQILDKDDIDVTATALDIKPGGPFKIRYRVKGTDQSISHSETKLQFFPDEINQVHTDFYGGPPVTVVSEVVDAYPEVLVNGFYETEWEGRDNTGDDRILLQGSYDVDVEVEFEQNGATVNARTKNPNTIEIGLPHASNYGPYYPEEAGQWGRDFRGIVGPSIGEQQDLRDFTAYQQLEPLESQASSAGQAIQRLKSEDAVFHYVGQTVLVDPDPLTLPTAVLYYDDPNPGELFDPLHSSGIAGAAVSYPGGSFFGGGLQYVEDLEETSLDDVLLSVVMACYTDSVDPSADLDYLPSQMIAKGVDLTVGANCFVKGELGTTWEQVFWDCVCNEETIPGGSPAGVRNCTSWAGDVAVFVNQGNVDPMWFPCIQSLVVRTGPGIDENQMVYPARYGNAVN